LLISEHKNALPPEKYGQALFLSLCKMGFSAPCMVLSSLFGDFVATNIGEILFSYSYPE